MPAFERSFSFLTGGMGTRVNGFGTGTLIFSLAMIEVPKRVERDRRQETEVIHDAQLVFNLDPRNFLLEPERRTMSGLTDPGA
jgi:hypothetical protein